MSLVWLDRIRKELISLWDTADQVARGKAVERVEDELEELEYIFALLSQGAFVGMPSPPVQISLDLLPAMETDLILLMERVETANEPLSRLFSVFDIS
jgi:hypothetical protein